MTVLLLDNFIKKKFSEYFSDYYNDDIEIMDATKKQFPMDLTHYSHIILSGSEDSILEDRDWARIEMDIVRHAIELKTPILGICYGHQLIAKALGGSEFVRKRDTAELGWKYISQTMDDPIFDGIPKDFNVFVYHFDEVTEAANVKVLAWSDECNIHTLKVKDVPVYGVQFHPEIDMDNGKHFLNDLKDMHPQLHLEIEMALDEAQDCQHICEKFFHNFYALPLW